MTPIKAAADPSELLALADKLEPQQYATGIAFSYRDFRMVIDALRLVAAPAGNAGATPEYVLSQLHAAIDDIDISAYNAAKYRISLVIAALPQPPEAFADEIKRADAAPPEASFDNASDMLGYLNAPREAAPVTPITNPLMLPAGIKAGDYASRSPIPEAPGREEIIEECAKVVDRILIGDNCISRAIRALKPQDGGESGL